MQFQVPQFIEVEDKVFGPFSFRQFLYLAGGVGLSFICYVYLPIYLSLILILALLGFAAALTFYKHNGRDFIFLVESVFKYTVAKKLYLWKKDERQTSPSTQKAPVTSAGQSANLSLPRLSESKLKDLAWSLDVKSNQTPNEESSSI